MPLGARARQKWLSAQNLALWLSDGAGQGAAPRLNRCKWVPEPQDDLQHGKTGAVGEPRVRAAQVPGPRHRKTRVTERRTRTCARTGAVLLGCPRRLSTLTQSLADWKEDALNCCAARLLRTFLNHEGRGRRGLDRCCGATLPSSGQRNCGLRMHGHSHLRRHFLTEAKGFWTGTLSRDEGQQKAPKTRPRRGSRPEPASVAKGS